VSAAAAPENGDNTVKVLTPQELKDLAYRVKGLIDTHNEFQNPGVVDQYLSGGSEAAKTNLTPRMIANTLHTEQIPLLNRLAEAAGVPNPLAGAMAGDIAPLQQIYDRYLEPGRPLLIVGPDAKYQDVLANLSGTANRVEKESGELANILAHGANRASPLVVDYSNYRNAEVTEFFSIFGVGNYAEYNALGARGRMSARGRYDDAVSSNWNKLLYMGDWQMHLYPSLPNLPPDLQLAANMSILNYAGELAIEGLFGLKEFVAARAGHGALGIFSEMAAEKGIMKGYSAYRESQGVPPQYRIFDYAR
jgi:hypothetical protein